MSIFPWNFFVWFGATVLTTSTIAAIKMPYLWYQTLVQILMCVSLFNPHNNSKKSELLVSLFWYEETRAQRGLIICLESHANPSCPSTGRGAASQAMLLGMSEFSIIIISILFDLMSLFIIMNAVHLSLI